MRLFATDEGGLRIDRIDHGCMSLLRETPRAGDPRGDSRAFDRLYPRPMEDSEDDLNDDWTDLIQPDLQHLFESNNQTMQRDLDTAEQNEKGWAVEISASHFDAWISALNQARIVLASRFRIGEEEMTSELPFQPSNPRDFARLRMHLYEAVLGGLIHLQMGDLEAE